MLGRYRKRAETMSEVTIKICDVKGCRAEAPINLPIMLICQQREGKEHSGSFEIFSEPDVDLCIEHDREYRQALPDIEIERKKS